MWILVAKTPGFQYQYKVDSKITQYDGKANIKLFSSDLFDQVAVINGDCVLTKRYNFIETEVLSHVAASTCRCPSRALVFGGYNVEVAHELKKHRVKTDVVVPDIEVLNVLSGFFENFRSISRDEDIKIRANFFELDGSSGYDLIFHLGKVLPHELVAMNKLAAKEYVMLFRLPDVYMQTESALDTMRHASQFAKVLMPFVFNDGIKTEYFAYLSNAFHPIADLKLQVSDMLDGLKCYNPKLHEGAFCVSNEIRAMFSKVTKI